MNESLQEIQKSYKKLASRANPQVSHNPQEDFKRNQERKL